MISKDFKTDEGIKENCSAHISYVVDKVRQYSKDIHTFFAINFRFLFFRHVVCAQQFISSTNNSNQTTEFITDDTDVIVLPSAPLKE